MRKIALARTVGKKVLKSVGKAELSRASGGLSELVTGRSRLRQATDTVTGVRSSAQDMQNKVQGVGLKERNKIPSPPKPPEPPKMVTASVHKTYEDMMHLEKRASIGNVMLAGAGTTLGAMGAVGAVHGANKIYQKIKTEKTWNQLKKRHPDLARTRQDRENFEVLQQFSPSLASNITTARSYMQRAQHTHMTPHEFVGDLTNTEQRMHQMSAKPKLEDIASKSVNHGLDYERLTKKSSLKKGLSLYMDKIYDL